MDIRETHIPPAKKHCLFIPKERKSLSVSREAFGFKQTLCPLSQNLCLYYAMDIRKAHITPAKPVRQLRMVNPHQV